MRASIDRSKASTKPTALDGMTGVDSMLHSYGMLVSAPKVPKARVSAE